MSAIGAVLPRLEQGHVVDVAAKFFEVDFNTRNALTTSEDFRLRFESLRDEHADGGREAAVEIEPFLIANELFNASDFADAFDFNDDGSAFAIAAQKIDGPYVGGVFALEEFEVGLKGFDARREQRLQFCFVTVLFEAGVEAELERHVGEHLVKFDDERLTFWRVGANRTVALDDGARRVHPVQRFIRFGIRVDRDRTVGLQDYEARCFRESRAKPPLILH